nr:hypothetical protein [Mangrovimonas aestuarii]
MSVLVLLSTVFFTVEKHFCGDKLIDMAILTKAKSCCPETTSEVLMLGKGCCKSVVDVVQGQDELTVKSFNDLDLSHQLFLTAFTCSFINLFEGLPQQVVPHKDYSPPKLVYDHQLMDQVFLI